MSVIKRTAEQFIHHILRARNVPEAKWPERVKKTGRGMMLLGVATVVPLLLVDDISLPVTIALQLCYAVLLCVGVILAFDNKKSDGRP
ncbi:MULTISPECIES: hypothetical protein [unclassified Lelliottia]|uniref:hypothetical protein n=1 Tax=unclassified Lelliottia TaxID=2642424 RepID=UPI00193DE0A2|nr:MULTISPECIES: hypothetical protein [unclassified Lelliottia]MBM3074039.1 hypothetical protein [Lelliottia sp. RWM.1]CAI9405393.1 hypothetical protein CCAJJPOJ_04220 [Lelliottia sp. T2.26D-8]HEE3302680.1 hypothetical protein [Klebsiella pneumoniae]